ncbi:hypothetical protein [Planctomicrobium piriforme]|uniref:GWxTD domain-containing protein n=1 Tax=Planctomicrobium piriforme TaxID=1576369 RepID=A0A1I3RLE3_9PLAN|nr:hypothetical protein [Planctomicrobium piriforme]SFJ46682.1 hypothetical protein SAMN05421753_12130 [Planctomicrobium piriforme]
MIRWARHSGVLLIALSLGCAAAPPRWDFSKSFLPGARKPQTETPTEEVQHQDEEPEEDDDPLIASVKPSNGTLRHDPATRMLIDAELQDATPEERAEWMAFLNTVEPAQVPYILRARRISEGRDGEQLASKDKSSDVLPAGHSGVEADSGPSIVNVSATSESPVTAQKQASPDSQATSSWQKRFKSLADPNWLWSHSPDSDPTLPDEKPERTPFGLPTVLGGHPRPEAAAPIPLEEAPEPVVTAMAAPPARAPAVSPAVTPRLTPGSELWEDEMQKLISLLEAETSSLAGATADHEDVRKQVALRMLYLVQNEPQKAQQTIPGLPPNEQEFWTDLFLGLAEQLDHSGAIDPGERATQTMAHLRTAAFHLQQTARLRLRNVAFCQEINSFGNYETYPADEFAPGQTVLIYAEIRNFLSEPTQEGFYRTRIKSTIEIYTGGTERQLVDRSSFDATEDLCRTLRSDYYHSYRIDLPPHLGRGQHAVKLILQDEVSGKIATETIEFTIR